MAAGIASGLQRPLGEIAKREIPPGACSFCGKGKPEVYVIQGPAVAICNECVGLCIDICREEKVPFGIPYLTVNYRRHEELEPFRMPAKGKVIRLDSGTLALDGTETWVWKHIGEGTLTQVTWTPKMTGEESQEFIREHVYNGLGSERGTVHAFWRINDEDMRGFHVGLLHVPTEVQEEKVTGDKPSWAFEL